MRFLSTCLSVASLAGLSIALAAPSINSSQPLGPPNSTARDHHSLLSLPAQQIDASIPTTLISLNLPHVDQAVLVDNEGIARTQTNDKHVRRDVARGHPTHTAHATTDGLKAVSKPTDIHNVRFKHRKTRHRPVNGFNAATMTHTTLDQSTTMASKNQATISPSSTINATSIKNGCDVSWHYFRNGFEIRGKNFDEKALGAWGQGLLDNLRGDCGDVYEWGFDYTPENRYFDWKATGRLLIRLTPCFTTAIPKAGGNMEADCDFSSLPFPS